MVGAFSSRTTKSGLASWVVGALGALSLGGCGGDDGGDPGPAQPPPKVDTGVRLPGSQAYTILTGDAAQPGTVPAPAAYAAQGCNLCHGNAAEGVNLLGPEIRHAPAGYLGWVVRNGRAGTTMVPFPADMVPDADVFQIHAWLAALPRPTTGQELYLDFCGNCHGPAGGGGSVPVKAQGLPATTLVQTVRAGAGVDPGVRRDYMPAFSATELTDAELSLIATFLGAI